MLWVAIHFPGLPPASLEPLAAWACQFTPKVALEPPDALLAEVQGSVRYFGGLERFLETLRRGLDELGFAAIPAVAATSRAALWLARAGGGPSCRADSCAADPQDLEALPLQVTGFDLELPKSIGIATLGELVRLPRDGLALRCGQAMLDELDRALGKLPETHAFFVPPPRFAARLELPAAVEHAEALLFAARRLLAQLEGLLAARHAGVRRFSLRLIQKKSAEILLDIGLASPARDAARFAGLLGERLGTLTLSSPVEAIALEAGDFVPLGPRTAGMFGDAAAEEEDWARLIERLRQRLGLEAVCGLATQPDHRPEQAWRRVEPGEWDPREFRRPGPRPLWLLEAPRRLGAAPFTLLAGPERIECGWWDGDEAKRDYFIAELGRGALGWIYREAGEWHLHGLFA
jgi:protein ImuB